MQSSARVCILCLCIYDCVVAVDRARGAVENTIVIIAILHYIVYGITFIATLLDMVVVS